MLHVCGDEVRDATCLMRATMLMRMRWRFDVQTCVYVWLLASEQQQPSERLPSQMPSDMSHVDGQEMSHVDGEEMKTCASCD